MMNLIVSRIQEEYLINKLEIFKKIYKLWKLELVILLFNANIRWNFNYWNY